MSETEPVSTNSSTPPGCGLWLAWVIANMIASGIGWRLGWFISEHVPGAIAIYMIGSVFAVILGVGQWLVVRNEIHNSSSWLAASLIGYAAGFSGGVVIASNLGLTEFRLGIVTGTTFGAVSALLQWFVLARQVTRAYIWIPASIFAWGTAFFYYAPRSIWVGAFYGLVSGLITATALMWLLYRPSD